MALVDSLLRVKDKVSSTVSNFFYPREEYPRDDRMPTRQGRRARNADDRGRGDEGYVPYAEEQDGARETEEWSVPQVRESSPFQNTNPYQAPPRERPQTAQPYGQAQPYAQGAQQQPAPQAQPYAQGAQQQPYAQGAQQYAPDARQQGQDANILYFPNAPQGREVAARVITARSVSDCYSAITQLRLGDMVILVMDGIGDPAEMRHYVDMLSGACYSLRATITKLSRHGAYLICPSQIRVYVDAATNQLNSGARQPQRPLQNPYGQARYAPGAPYAPSGREEVRGDYAHRPDDYAPSVGRDGRDYYGRSAMPDAQGTADRLQPYANGYMPDSPMDEMRAQ